MKSIDSNCSTTWPSAARAVSIGIHVGVFYRLRVLGLTISVMSV